VHIYCFLFQMVLEIGLFHCSSKTVDKIYIYYILFIIQNK
jgi:hypothetical protein